MIKTKGGEDRRYEENSPSGDSEKMSEKEVDVDCVIFFYQKGKCGDNHVSKERSRVKLKDIAEVKREIR